MSERQVVSPFIRDHVGKMFHKLGLLPNEERLVFERLCGYLGAVHDSKYLNHLPALLPGMKSLPIASMYVELSVAPGSFQTAPGLLQTRMTLAEYIGRRDDWRRARRVSLDTAIGKTTHHHTVILGDPGSGKSSLLKHSAIKVAHGTWPRFFIPIYIPIKHYWRTFQRYREAAPTFLDWASFSLEIHGKVSTKDYSPDASYLFTESNINKAQPMRAFLQRVAGEKSPIIFLIDGLDEVAADPDAVAIVQREIQTLNGLFPWVATSRRAGFIYDLQEDIRYDVVSLHDEAIDDLIKNWFHHQVSEKRIQTLKESLHHQIFQSPRLLQMARNPFLLTLLCYLQHCSDEPLPVQRSVVYERIFEAVAEQVQKYHQNPKLFGFAEQRFLADFCHYLYTDAPGAPRQFFRGKDFSAFAAPDKPPSLRKHYLASRLMDRWHEMDDYHLVHLTLHEFLVAQSLVAESVDVVLPHLYKPHWRVVIRFLGGLYWYHDKREDFRRLLKALIDPPDRLGFLYVEAAHILVEAGIDDSTSLLGVDLLDKLWQTLVNQEPYLSEAAAEALAVWRPAEMLTKLPALVDAYTPKYADPLEELLARRDGVQNLKNPPVFLVIGILGQCQRVEAKRALVDLFFSDSPLANSTIEPLANALDPQTRRLCLGKAPCNFDTELFERFCELVYRSGHDDFVNWMIDSLGNVELHHSQPLLVAMRAFNHEKLGIALGEWVECQGSESIPVEALHAWKQSRPESARDYVHQHLDVLLSRGMTRRLVRAGFFNNDELLALLETHQQDTLNGMFELAEEEGETFNLALVDALIERFESRPNDYELLDAMTFIQKNRLGELHGLEDHLAKILETSEDSIMQSSATFGIGRLRAHQFAPRMLEIAGDRAFQEAVRLGAINALIHLEGLPKKDLVSDLCELFFKENPRMQESLAEAIGAHDLHTLHRLRFFPKADEAMARCCAEQGILFFDDGFVTTDGMKHPWHDQQSASNKHGLTRPNVLANLALPIELEGMASPLIQDQNQAASWANTLEQSLTLPVDCYLDDLTRMLIAAGDHGRLFELWTDFRFLTLVMRERGSEFLKNQMEQLIKQDWPDRTVEPSVLITIMDTLLTFVDRLPFQEKRNQFEVNQIPEQLLARLSHEHPAIETLRSDARKAKADRVWLEAIKASFQPVSDATASNRQHHDGAVIAIVLDESNGRILTAGEDGAVYAWHPVDLSVVDRVICAEESIAHLQVDESTDSLLVICDSGRLTPYQLSNFNHGYGFSVSSKALVAVRAVLGGKAVAVTEGDTHLVVWDWKAQEPRLRCPTVADVIGLTYHHGRLRLAAILKQGFSVWDVYEGLFLFEEMNADLNIHQGCFHASGDALFLATENRILKLDFISGESIVSQNECPSSPTAMTMANGLPFLLTVHSLSSERNESIICLWHPETLKMASVFTSDVPITCVQVTSDCAVFCGDQLGRLHGFKLHGQELS